MTGPASHSFDTAEGSHSPASVVTPRNMALTATVTCVPRTIAANRATKAELFVCAKRAIECGERNLRDAAEALGRAQDNHGATQREMAKAVGMSVGWVNRLLKWRQAGYNDASPFGPTTKKGRVQHAEQRQRPEEQDDGAPNTRDDSAGCSTQVPAKSPSANVSGRRKWSPTEAKGNLRYAIDQWWPWLDGNGRAEIVQCFKDKAKLGTL
jgi:hypothetical protein